MRTFQHPILLLVVCAALLGAAHAEDVPKPAFQNTFAAGFTLTDGNSETMLANGSLVSEGEREGLGSLRVALEGNYGTSTVRDETAGTERDEVTVGNAKLQVGGRKTLTERTYAALDGSLVHDGVAEIRYRGMVGPALGCYLLKSGSAKLSLDAGLSCVWEDVADVRDDYAAVRVTERFELAISKTAKVWQSVEYLPELGDAENFLMNAELGAEAALNAHLNLRVLLQDKYDSRPAANLERNDLSVISGISVKF